ncbi:aminotransferase class I/II-fold pyridoxal phosphate-dependent enzyme [Streptomyces sp. MRC013]|uniref:aminotransferase class I/II-fold pyridoxal phosphate-dependent enzyme n=1 Tax=Streptomyces sp. MRC013 TaxID=2898276 RepID=UPI00202652F0|nr:aminotransferase class I/II-fold pyridoxal phosphate-dependent enzyme [Streptomyces sp. MRC013]URM92566.1 aminotransferase class I/II-fold pyridoxal phosphate-dependent enzyme [Streptomyces sp. MRC013]
MTRSSASGHPHGHGQVRYAPPAPDTGLPVVAELAGLLAGAASRPDPEPPGGGPVLREAACGYWSRRGLRCHPEDLLASPGTGPLLTALLAAHGGDVLVPRPCPLSWTPQIRLLGRPAYHVPTPAECGGVPDPYALLETVRRVRAEGGRPAVLLLSVADDPTGTVAPPEPVREACEAAVGEGLHIVSDETWRDTVHHPHDTVFVSPAEMCPDDVTVLCDLAGSVTPASWPAAVARFPAGAPAAAHRSRALDVLTALGADLPGPLAVAVAHALDEPEAVTARNAAATALHARLAAEAHRVVLAAGALALPPEAGRHLYADLGPLRGPLAARGVTDSVELEDHLTARLGVPVPGGHRFGDELGALRVRLATTPLLGATQAERLAALDADDPLDPPHVARALEALSAALLGTAPRPDRVQTAGGNRR